MEVVVENFLKGRSKISMIHVAYRLWGGDGFFAKMCGVSMLSMFENTKEKITVHIMHNERLTP
ncbi:MAG: hypothetical protein IJT06_00890, partial [Selenomonadaceae bacterium]|nr:hypothetical protein [Selenomonadaceae bacterium]